MPAQEAGHRRIARRRPVRHWWQRALRLAVLLGMVGLTLYATLPWWLPKGMLARIFAEQLSARLGLPVSIDRLDVSWQEGIVLEGLCIRDSEDFGGGDMIRVGSVRCDLSPLRLLTTGRLKWAEIGGAELHVRVNQARQVNLAALQRVLEEGSPPEWVVVHGATVTVRLPRDEPSPETQAAGDASGGEPVANDRRLQLDVSDLQFRAGRLVHLGTVTMSAALNQEGAPAPVSLMASAGELGGNVATRCHFRFSRIDLVQLSLHRLLRLPLERLTGEASGKLDCRINTAGVVDQFDLAVKVKDLDAQPLSGPALPVVHEAGVSLSASYDPWPAMQGAEGERLEVSSFELRLPGMDLAGSALLEPISRAGIRQFVVEGKVDPGIVSALVSGQTGPLPGGLEIDGDVKVRLALRRKENYLTADVKLDAVAAEVRHRQRVCKPAGTALSLDFQEAPAKGTCDFAVRLGENRFDGSQDLQRVRDALGRWYRAGDAATLPALVEDLVRLNWHGSWETVELEPLRVLVGPAWPKDVRLSGRIDGAWSVRHGEQLTVDATLNAPAGTNLAVGRRFVKPFDQVLRVVLSGELNIQSPRLEHLHLLAGVGRAGVSIEDGSVALYGDAPGGNDAGPHLRASGHFGIRDVEGLSRCVPLAGTWLKALAGDAGGEFHLMHSASFSRLHVQANAAPLAAKFGEAFEKAAGQPADVTLDFRTDRALPPERRTRLTVIARLGGDSLQADLGLPPRDSDAPVRVQAQLAVADADWLLQRMPALAKTLQPYRPRGSLRATARGQFRGQEFSGELTCDADNLEFRLPQTDGLKPHGLPLRLRLAGACRPDALTIDLLTADVGKSSLVIDGAVTLAPPGLTALGDGESSPGRTEAAPTTHPAERLWPPPRVVSTRLNIRGRLARDAAWQALLPRVNERAAGLGLDGSVRIDARLDGQPEGIELAGRIVADDLVVQNPWFRKPSGAPATGEFAASVPADLGEVHVRDLFLDVGGVQLRADAKLPLFGRNDAEAHLAVNVPDLRRSSDRLPWLERFAPEGSLSLDAELARRDGQAAIKYVTLTAGNIIGAIGKRPWRVDGTLTLENIVPTGDSFTLGRAATEGLEFALGNTRGFIVADVKQPLTAPEGNVQVLCNELDVVELVQWGQPAATSPAEPTGPLGEKQAEQLKARADDALAKLRSFALPANADLRIQAERLRYYDAEVRALYEARGLVADVSARDGTLRARYRCGLNGGDVDQQYAVNLKDADPRLFVRGELREVMSGPTILAQLSKEFPGNTFTGTFSRSHDLSYRLRDVVANGIDARFRPPAVGSSLTVTEDGLLRGRAAPPWMASIFPGLNLTTYRYRRMTGFTQYVADGSSDSDMVFDGSDYDIYIEGSTDAHRVGQYEIGVILLAGPQSAEFNHLYRTGRLPVLNFKARIEGGQFLDQEVWFKYPTETAYVLFLKNNPVYRLWLEVARKHQGKSISNGPSRSPATGGG